MVVAEIVINIHPSFWEEGKRIWIILMVTVIIGSRAFSECALVVMGYKRKKSLI